MVIFALSQSHSVNTCYYIFVSLMILRECLLLVDFESLIQLVAFFSDTWVSNSEHFSGSRSVRMCRFSFDLHRTVTIDVITFRIVLSILTSAWLVLHIAHEQSGKNTQCKTTRAYSVENQRDGFDEYHGKHKVVYTIHRIPKNGQKDTEQNLTNRRNQDVAMHKLNNRSKKWVAKSSMQKKRRIY